VDTAPTLSELSASTAARFAEVFGHAPQWIVAAPGRVNLIGEHTDYNDGFVLPMAIERYMVLAAAPGAGSGNVIRAFSDYIAAEHTFTVGQTEPLPPWCVYLHGVFDLLTKRGLNTGPLEVLVTSTVPLGGGLSSSAALEVATATLVEAVTGHTLDGRDKAKLCQQAENDYVGMPCGIMDQFSSALCQAGQAMRLDCRSLETTPVPLSDPNVSILIINSNVKHELSNSEYPLRRAQCEEATAALGVKSLRDAMPELLAKGRSKLSEIAFCRARHVIGEIARVLEFSTAATAGNWTRAGELMYASHESLRDDYEVSCPQVDTLVELARKIGPAGGVYGSRITGGGFGGCTVTLCETSKAAAIADRILAEYHQRTGIEALAFTSRPAQGAHVVR
jgi:galactokinase